MTHITHNFSLKNIEKDGVFTGYANVFNIIDHHSDKITHGAFQDIETSKIKLLWQHDPHKPIGKILEIREDKKGLYVKCFLLLQIEQGRETYFLLKEGIIDGLSIGYIPLEYDIKKNGIRVLYKVNVLEISLVTFPANPESRVTSVKERMNYTKNNYTNFSTSITKAINILKR